MPPGPAAVPRPRGSRASPPWGGYAPGTLRHRIGRLEDLQEGGGRLVEVGGREIALFRRAGRVYALDNVCPHRGAALAFGDVRGEVVHCPLHAWPFELATGRCPEVPEASVRTYPVRVEGGELELEL